MKSVKLITMLFVLIYGSGLWVTANGQEKTKSAETKWYTLEEAQKLAAESDRDKLIMLFVEAEWCGICKEMHKRVFPEADVAALMNSGFLPVTLDLDSREPVTYFDTELTERELARKLNVQATPTTIFIDRSGEALANHRGWLDTDDLTALLTFMHSEKFGEIDFDEFRDKF